jgi:osmotically-inducible protein OsmY
MMWLLLLPFRLAYGSGKVTAKVGHRSARLVGYRRLALVAVGVGVGLLVAPVPGRDARRALRRRIDARRAGSDPELGERVRFELAHHPRTWHLPQPTVAVVARRVTLKGSVPDEGARHELVRAAAALPGVASVDDSLEIAGTNARR